MATGVLRQQTAAMHTRHCLKLADRIHRALVREIGQGLDRQRLLREPLYARDVLLVCDALHHSDLPDLARHFRRACAAKDDAEEAAARVGFGSGFSASRFFNFLFGQPAPSASATRYVTKAAA